MKMEPIRSSETSAIRTQTPGNYQKRNNLQELIYFHSKNISQACWYPQFFGKAYICHRRIALHRVQNMTNRSRFCGWCRHVSWTDYIVHCFYKHHIKKRMMRRSYRSVYTCLTQPCGGIDMYNLLRKDQLHVSALIIGHLQVDNWRWSMIRADLYEINYTYLYHHTTASVV